MLIMCMHTYNIFVFIILIILLAPLGWWRPSWMQRLNLGEVRLCPSFIPLLRYAHIVAICCCDKNLITWLGWGLPLLFLRTNMHLVLHVFRLEPAELYPTNPFQNMNHRIVKPFASQPTHTCYQKRLNYVSKIWILHSKPNNQHT